MTGVILTFVLERPTRSVLRPGIQRLTVPPARYIGHATLLQYARASLDAPKTRLPHRITLTNHDTRDTTANHAAASAGGHTRSCRHVGPQAIIGTKAVGGVWREGGTR